MAAGLLFASPAHSLITIEGKTSATFGWAHAAGPVAGYYVVISFDGAPELFYTVLPKQNWVVINGQIGPVMEIAVAAYDATGKVGPVSQKSEPFQFVVASPPPTDPPDTGNPPPGEDPPGEDPPEPGDPVLGTAFDFDADGRSDLLARDGGGNAVELWSMDDRGVAAVTAFSGDGRDSEIVGDGDYDGDGTADILWLDPATGRLTIFYMEGGAVAASAVLANSLASGWAIVGSGDYNGDGLSDVLINNASGNKFRIALMAEDASYDIVSIPDQDLPEAVTVIASGDFDGDGLSDIAWRGIRSGEVSVWGTSGNLTHGKLEGSGSSSVIIGAGDFDGDGRHDFLLRGGWKRLLSVRLSSTGARSEIASDLNSARSDREVLAMGDYDGDGMTDLVVYDGARNETNVWYLDGSSVHATALLGGLDGSWSLAGVDDRPAEAP